MVKTWLRLDFIGLKCDKLCGILNNTKYLFSLDHLNHSKAKENRISSGFEGNNTEHNLFGFKWEDRTKSKDQQKQSRGNNENIISWRNI